MSDPLTRAVADVLRHRNPALAAEFDRAIQAGHRPEQLFAWAEAEAARVGGAPGQLCTIAAYLSDVDPDFRRAMLARVADPERTE